MLTIDLFEELEELEGPPEPTLIDALRDFLPIAVKHLKIKKLPKIKLLPDVDTEHLASFGKFSNEDRMVHVDINNRHPNDVLRTLAHELTHYAQGEQDRLDADSWQTGSSIEDEANAEAGVIMREFNQQFPQYMELKPIILPETWTKKYKKSINCSNPKGFSQKAHCAARRARQAGRKTKSKSVSEQQLDEKCWPGYHKEGNKKMFGKTYPNCVKNKKSNEGVVEGSMPTMKKPCARTNAIECTCESIKQITENLQTITAICVLEHSDLIQGTILMKQKPNLPTLIVGRITGLEPGLHGFHIHEFGDLSRGCESAGKHYNPDGEDHGDLDTGHVGDLGNITANKQGVAMFSIVAERVDLIGARSVVGRSIVVHENPDDLGQDSNEESRKSGNAGDRLACGVITLKETLTEAARVARKPGQPAKSKQHSDLYTDEDPRGTITGLKFATVEDARASVTKIRRSGRSHAHKIQAAVAMEQRAKAAGKASAAAVYRKYINANKKTK